MGTPMVTDSQSDRLLRTLASVPVSSSMLHVGCGDGRHTEALLRLGFPVHACDPRGDAVEDTRAVVRELVDAETAASCVQQRSLQTLQALDETFDWAIVDRTEALADSVEQVDALLEKLHDLVTPGGWVYLTVPAAPDDAEEGGVSGERRRDDTGIRLQPSDLEADALDTDLVESRSPSRVRERGTERIHAVYRRVKRSGTG